MKGIRTLSLWLKTFRRHDNCGCSVTYEDGEMRQDAWSKRTWQASPEELAEHKELEEKLKPVRFSPEEAAAKEREVLESKNYAKTIDIFNFEDMPISNKISPQAIADELEKTSIGKETLKTIDTLPEKIKLTFGYDEGVRGSEHFGKIEIYVNQCDNALWAARTIIHECTHYKYGIGQSQWAECVCIAQELKHARNRDYLTISEKRAIIKAVKEDSDYSRLNWRKGGTIYGRRKSH